MHRRAQLAPLRLRSVADNDALSVQTQTPSLHLRADRLPAAGAQVLNRPQRCETAGLSRRVFYSLDSHEFSLDCIGAAFHQLAEQGQLQEGAVYFEVECELVTPACFDNVDGFLDSLQMSLYAQAGAASDADFTAVEPVAKAELQLLIERWIDKHVNVRRYWRVAGPTVTRTVTRQEIDVFRP